MTVFGQDGSAVGQVEAEMRRARKLAGDVAAIAKCVAAQVEELAAKLEQRADLVPERAEELHARAARLREFARHEHGEEQRWRRVHDGEDRS
jgi:hypothetical protein